MVNHDVQHEGSMKHQLKESRFFYGWYIILTAFIANFMSVGTGFYVFNAFMQPLCTAHGWSRTDISLALSAGGVIGILGQLLYGTLVLRIGPRLLMTGGSLLAGTVFTQLGKIDELWLFYLLYMLLLLGNGAYGGIVANTAVNNWFVLKRGRAIGFATAGISLSGAVIPFIALLVIEHADVRSAFSWIGVAVTMVAPMALLVMRNRPEDCGLQPDGIADSRALSGTHWAMVSTSTNGGVFIHEKKRPSPVLHWTPATVWRLKTFWTIGIAYAMVMIGVVGVLSQLKPRFTDIGFTDYSAMAMLSLTAFFGSVGKFVWGILCDRYDPRRVVASLMSLGGISLIFSLFEDSVPLLLVFATVFGFAMGGVMSTFPILIATFFGRDSFASVARVLALFFVLQMLGYPIASASFDLTGSYNAAYLMFIALNFLGAVMIYSVEYPPPVQALSHRHESRAQNAVIRKWEPGTTDWVSGDE